MKKKTKWLALLLASVMSISTLTVGFSAFAATTPEAIKAIEADIMASDKKMSETLIEKIKALTADEKDLLGVEAYAKAYNIAYNSTTVYGSTVERCEKSFQLLGGLSTAGVKASELAKAINGYDALTGGNNTSGVDFKNNTGLASYTFTADYAVPAVTGAMVTAATVKYAGHNLVEQAALTVTVEQQKKVFLDVAKMYSDYAKNDPRVIAIADSMYGGFSNAAGTGGSSIYMYTYAYMSGATNTILSTAAKYIKGGLGIAETDMAASKTALDSIITLPSADFYNLAGGVAKAIAVATKFQTYLDAGDMSKRDFKYFEDNVFPWVAESKVANSNDWLVAKISQPLMVVPTYTKLASPSNLQSRISSANTEMNDYKDYVGFVDYMNAMQLPAVGTDAYNTMANAMKDAFNGLSSGGKTLVRADVAIYGKYQKILADATLVAKDDQHELFTPEVSKELLPLTDVLKNIHSTLINEVVNGMLAKMIDPNAGDLQTALSSYFTNETITMLVKMVYPAIYDLMKVMDPIDASILGIKAVPSLFNLLPQHLAGQFDVKKLPALANAKTALTACGPSSVETGKWKLDQWANADSVAIWSTVPDDTDWGVKDGDYETFMYALLHSLRGITTGLGAGIFTSLLGNMFVGSYSMLPDGSGIDMTTFKPAGWNNLVIPLFEALGVDDADMPTATEYALSITGDKSVDAGNSFYKNLKPIVDVVWYKLLPKIFENPVDYLATNLPNLVYHLEDGCLMDGVNELLNNAWGETLGNKIDLKPIIMGALPKDENGNPMESLSLDVIWGFVSPLLEKAGLNITLKDLFKIGRLGTPERAATTRLGVASTVKVVADKDSTFNYVANLANGILGKFVTGLDFSVKGEFVKVQVPTYPHDGKMGKDVVNKLISSLDETVLGFVNITDAINGGLATQEMAGTAIEGIYKALEGFLPTLGIAPITPKRVADAMRENKKYSDIVAYLETPIMFNWSLVDFTLKNDDGEVVKQINMGFKNGNMNDFLDCITAAIRPLVDEVQKLGLLTNNVVDGKVVYGLYETLIIPTLEAIGLTPVATSETYTTNYNKLALTNQAEATDYLIQTILKPILSLLEKIENNPVATVMQLLPNIAYALKYNASTAFIGNLLLGDKNLADVINPLLDGLLKGVLPEKSTDKLVLNPINFDALISAGTVKTDNKSKSALHKTYTTVVADKADTFVTVFYYLFDTINTGDNLKTLKTLLGSLEMDATLKATLDSVVGTIFDSSREEALCFLAGMFADWTCPNEADDEAGKGTNGKTPGTGDSTIATLAVVSVLFSAGVAIVLLRKKKTIVE